MSVITEKEMCKLLNVSRVFLYQCRKRGMPYKSLGKKLIRYETEKVIEWLEQKKEG